MNLRTTLVLLLVVAALVGVLLFTKQKPDPTGSVDQPVLDGFLDRATVLRWTFREQPTIELRRAEDGSFNLVEPMADEASRARLGGIVNAFDTARMKVCELKDEGEDRKLAGLEPPAATFAATFADGATSAVDFGATSALGGRYLRKNGKIYLGANGLIEWLHCNLDDLRERTVFRTQEPEAVRVTVEHVLAGGGHETLILERHHDEWRLSSPVQARAERTTVRGFLRVLLGLHIDQFPFGTVRLPTGPPDVRIEVHGARGEERVRLWLDPGRNLFGQKDGRKVVFASDDKQYGMIFEDAATQLRSQVLVPLHSAEEELAEFVVDPGTGPTPKHVWLRLVRGNRDAKFKLAEPIVSDKIAPTPVAEMMSGLKNLVVQEFCAGAPTDPRFQFTTASPRIGFRSFTDREIAWIRFGGEGKLGDQEIRYAQRIDDGEQVVAVPKAAVADLLRPWATYCSREVLAMTVPVEMLICEQEREGRTEQGPVYKSTPDGWIREGDKKPMPLVGNYVNDSLRDLRAAETLGAREQALGKADWRLSLARGNGDRLMFLDIWERGGAPQPLVVQPQGETDLVYELTKDASAALRGLRARD